MLIGLFAKVSPRISFSPLITFSCFFYFRPKFWWWSSGFERSDSSQDPRGNVESGEGVVRDVSCSFFNEFLMSYSVGCNEVVPAIRYTMLKEHWQSRCKDYSLWNAGGLLSLETKLNFQDFLPVWWRACNGRNVVGIISKLPFQRRAPVHWQNA